MRPGPLGDEQAVVPRRGGQLQGRVEPGHDGLEAQAGRPPAPGGPVELPQHGVGHRGRSARDDHPGDGPPPVHQPVTCAGGAVEVTTVDQDDEPAERDRGGSGAEGVREGASRGGHHRAGIGAGGHRGVGEECRGREAVRSADAVERDTEVVRDRVGDGRGPAHDGGTPRTEVADRGAGGAGHAVGTHQQDGSPGVARQRAGGERVGPRAGRVGVLAEGDEHAIPAGGPGGTPGVGGGPRDRGGGGEAIGAGDASDLVTPGREARRHSRRLGRGAAEEEHLVHPQPVELRGDASVEPPRRVQQDRARDRRGERGGGERVGERVVVGDHRTARRGERPLGQRDGGRDPVRPADAFDGRGRGLPRPPTLGDRRRTHGHGRRQHPADDRQDQDPQPRPHVRHLPCRTRR